MRSKRREGDGANVEPMLKALSSFRSGERRNLIQIDRELIPVLIILCLATALRFYQIGTESLWIDEYNSLRITKYEDLLFHFCALYFAMLRAWMLLGDGDIWLRSLSVLFGIGSVFLSYKVACRLIGYYGALLSMIIIAISPLFLNHSQEIRMYMVSTFFSLLGTLFLLLSYETSKPIHILLWTFSRLFGLYSFPLNILLLLSDAVLILLIFPRKRIYLRRFFAGFLVIGLLWSPAVPRLTNATNDYMGGDWAVAKHAPSIPEVLAQLTAFTVYWPLRYVPQQQFWYYGFFTLLLTLLLCIALLTILKGEQQKKPLLVLSIWGLLPPLILLLVTYQSTSLWSTRYMLSYAPYIIMMLVAGFTYIWRWKRIVGIAVLTAYLIAVSGGLVRYYTVLDRENWDTIIEIISENEKPGDAIAISTRGIEIVLEHSYDGLSPIYVMDQLPAEKRLTKEIVENSLKNIPKVDSTLWLIYWRAQGMGGDNRHAIFRDTIEESFSIEDHYIDSKMRVELFKLLN
jgi:mannosyltransferase